MSEQAKTTFKVGDYVEFSHIEGFGGRGQVIRVREEGHCTDYRVAVHDAWSGVITDGNRELWLYAREMKRVEMTRDDVMRATLAHVRRVGELLVEFSHRLSVRAVNHDASKFSSTEFDAFAKATPQLAALTYGSDEYKAALKAIGPAVTLHQGLNSHHPEFYLHGVNEMDLLDLVEMVCDWKAAGERHADGSFERSIEIGVKRFDLSPQLVAILRNTARRLGWSDAAPKEAPNAVE